MPKKSLFPNLIAILSFTVAIAGIINDIFFTTHDFGVMQIRAELNPLSLDWVFAGTLLRVNGHNYVNAFFDVLLLLGAILYVVSKNTEVRLVRFVISIIFFSNTIIVAGIFFMPFFYHHIPTWITNPDIDLLYYTVNIFWIYTSYRILKYFGNNKELQKEYSEEEGQTNAYFVKALSGQRFLHALADILVAIAIFSPLLKTLAYISEETGGRFLHTQNGLLIAIIICRIIYYIFYETIFGATPAKLLTETRVVDYDGLKPSFKTVLIRTASRLVPFEAFSFFWEDGGWHDRWSETVVVKEENATGEEQI